VGVGLEIGIGEIRNLAGKAMELENVRLLDLPQIGAGTPLVDPQERIELAERRT